MMKSVITALLIILSVGAMAQSLDDIKGLAGKNQLDKAKDGIDKYLSNEKNARNGEGWFLKAQIYNAIARDANFKTQFPEARAQAFNAYKKYLETDSKAVEGTINQHAPLFDIAFGYQELATNAFNSKKFEEALAYFRNMESVEDYILKKGYAYNTFSFPAYDTQLYLNIAASAINAKREEVAVEYYKKIADKKIKDNGFDEIYRYLVEYYNKKGDKINFDKYLSIGKELYPTDQFWCEIRLDALKNDKKKLFTKYDELLATGCDNYFMRYNYAVEMYNYAYIGEKVPDDRAVIQKKLEEVLKKAITQKADPVEANLLMARHYFAIIKYLGDDYDAIKGTKPADEIKKKEIVAQVNKKYDDAFPYINALFTYYTIKPELTAGEKGQLKIVGSMMLEYWETKKDKAKIKECQDKLSTYN